MTATCDLHTRHQAGCADCRARAAERSRARTRAIAYGTHRGMQEPGPAREHVLRLHHDHGMSGRRIAEKAGVSKEVTRRLLNDGTSPLHPRVYDAILAVEPDTAPAKDRNLVPALGAARMLQALSAGGHHIDKIGAELGVQPAAAARWRRMHFPTITVATDRAIRNLYTRLGGINGGDEATRAYARTQQWAPAGAWDSDDDMDNPDATPDLEAVRNPIPAVLAGKLTVESLTPDERLRVVEYLIALRHSDRQIAEQLQWPGGIRNVQQYRRWRNLPAGRLRGEAATAERRARERRKARFTAMDAAARAEAIDRFDFGQEPSVVARAVGCKPETVMRRREARGDVVDAAADPELVRAAAEGRVKFADLNDAERVLLFTRYAAEMRRQEVRVRLGIAWETCQLWLQRLASSEVA